MIALCTWTLPVLLCETAFSGDENIKSTWFIVSLQLWNSMTMIDTTKNEYIFFTCHLLLFFSWILFSEPFYHDLTFLNSPFLPFFLSSLHSLFHSDLCTFLSSAAPFLLIYIFPLRLQIVSFNSSSPCPLWADSPFVIFILVFEVLLSSFLHSCSLDSETDSPFTTSLASLKGANF